MLARKQAGASDLKLDNCGLDHQSRAKIFDLGSVTSEGGQVKGTLFTRAPELFVSSEEADQPKSDFASDVWALGATLFALRSGDYPFVLRSEVQQRASINLAVRTGELTDEEGRQKKSALDELVARRICDKNAAESISSRVHSMLRGRHEEVLLAMLAFDRNQRKEIQHFEKIWSSLAEELGRTTPPRPELADKWQKIRQHLVLAEKKELVLTPGQINRIVSLYEINSPKDEAGELKKLLQLLKERE